MQTRNVQRGPPRGTSLSINQREYHNESNEKSPTDLALDQHRDLSVLRLAGHVDVSHHGLEAVDLVLTSKMNELGGEGRKKGGGSMERLCIQKVTSARPAADGDSESGYF